MSGTKEYCHTFLLQYSLEETVCVYVTEVLFCVITGLYLNQKCRVGTELYLEIAECIMRTVLTPVCC